MQDGKTALEIAEEKERSAVGEASHTSRRGMLAKLKDWWQKNRREINLVSTSLYYIISCNCFLPSQTRAAISGSVADVQKALDIGANPDRIANRVVGHM